MPKNKNYNLLKIIGILKFWVNKAPSSDKFWFLCDNLLIRCAQKIKKKRALKPAFFQPFDVKLFDLRVAFWMDF